MLFTTELLNSASDSDQDVISHASTEPGIHEAASESNRQTDEASVVDNGTGQIDADDAPADTDEKTCERKPSKIIFKDYYANKVSCQLCQFTREALLFGFIFA